MNWILWVVALISYFVAYSASRSVETLTRVLCDLEQRISTLEDRRQ